MDNHVEKLKKGDEVKLHRDERTYYFVEHLIDCVALSDDKDNLTFPNKFVQPIWIKNE